MEGDDLESDQRLRWEKKLVDRTLTGDERAFGELYRAYAPMIFARVLLPRLSNRIAAEDALAETFRAAFERLHQFEPRGVSIYFWIARVAVNKAMDMHRVRERTSRALSSFETLLEPLLPKPESPDARLEARADAQTLRDRVAEVMERLNPRYREAITLRFLEDRSREACAEALEVKIGTFDVVILRALRAFRREWERTLDET